MDFKKLLFLFFSVLCIIPLGCKTNKTINHHREGKWIYKDSVNGVLLKSKGRYRKSREIKTWKYFENRKLVKTEKYLDTICKIKTFDKQARLTAIGQSIIVEEKDVTHWYLNGDWIFFNDKGDTIGIKTYDKGVLLSETGID